LLRPDILVNRFSGSSPWSDGKVVFDIGEWNGGGRLQYKSPQSILDSWQHFAFVADRASGQMAIYRNGVLEASKNGRSFLRSGQYSLYVGGDATPFPGRLCEFRLWDHARSVAEIQGELHRVVAPQTSGLIAYVKGPEGYGLPVQ
jgi:hypothetical protein